MATPLTSADERGLHGLSLDTQVRQAFFAMPPTVLAELDQRMTAEAFRRSLVYVRDGQPEAIRILLRPTGVMPDQLAYLHYVSLTLINALKRLPDLYIQDFAIRTVVPLTPPEEQWLWDCWGPNQRENNPVLGRLDAVIDFTSPMWKDSLHYMEPNLSGVGGIHIIPVTEQLLAEIVMPVVQTYDPQLRLEAGQDLRELFIQEVLDHLEAIGHPGRNLCFIEPKYAGDGPVEQVALADYYRRQHGLTILHADPSELYLQDGEVCFDGQRVDAGYRDYEVRDMIALETEEGLDTRPLRALFKRNRMLSSLAGEFDHKSCWEVLTDPQFTHKYFTADERQVFRRHVLWTRVVADRRTTLPGGDTGGLLEFARQERELLVIKPNRSYGGEGILIGPSTTAADWEAALQQAVLDGQQGDHWVLQRLARIPVSEFPVVGPDGVVSIEPFYTVMGLAPTKYGLAILGRASQKQVVNVAQRGGLCTVLVGQPAGRIVGPGAPVRMG
jgi:diaminobutyrate-2-oxoglutarate transaminase